MDEQHRFTLQMPQVSLLARVAIIVSSASNPARDDRDTMREKLSVKYAEVNITSNRIFNQVKHGLLIDSPCSIVL